MNASAASSARSMEFETQQRMIAKLGRMSVRMKISQDENHRMSGHNLNSRPIPEALRERAATADSKAKRGERKNRARRPS